MFVCKTKKWGNSLGLLIPKPEAVKLNLQENREVVVEIMDLATLEAEVALPERYFESVSPGTPVPIDVGSGVTTKRPSLEARKKSRVL